MAARHISNIFLGSLKQAADSFLLGTEGASSNDHYITAERLLQSLHVTRVVADVEFVTISCLKFAKIIKNTQITFNCFCRNKLTLMISQGYFSARFFFR